MTDQPLHSVRVLIVEDDYWQATDCRDRLKGAGAHVVGMTGACAAALSIISTMSLDVGLLDINLGEEKSYSVARGLMSRGVPVLFLTGYDPSFLPSDLCAASVLTKPVAWDHVIARLVALLGPNVGAVS